MRGASGTGRPSSEERCSATGAIEYWASTLPFGRPRWLAHTTVASRSSNAVMVGSAETMRRSSSILPSRNGTLKSTRTSTRWPRSTRRSSSVGTFMTVWGRDVDGRRLLRADEGDEVDQPVRVAPLVVVPAEHLHQVVGGHGVACGVDARRRVADDVGRDERLVA